MFDTTFQNTFQIKLIIHNEVKWKFAFGTGYSTIIVAVIGSSLIIYERKHEQDRTHKQWWS